MISRTCTLLLALCSLLASHAQNLVPNPSFEDHVGATACSGGGSTWASYTGGFGSCDAGSGLFNRLHCTLGGGWYEPGGGSTDLYTTCACPATGTGIYRCQGQNPLLGTADAVPMPHGQNCLWLRYFGIADYAAVRLLSPMQAGKTYDISYWVRLSPRARYRHAALGLYFTAAPYTWAYWALPAPMPTPHFPTSPQYTGQATQWQLVSGTYTVPTGSPDLYYLTLGAWLPYAATATEAHRVLPDATSSNDADYLIDNLSVALATPLATTGVYLAGSSTGGLHTLTYSWPATPYVAAWLQHSTDGIAYTTGQPLHSQVGSLVHPSTGPLYYRLALADGDQQVAYSQALYLHHTAQPGQPVVQNLLKQNGTLCLTGMADPAPRLIDSQGRLVPISISHTLGQTIVTPLQPLPTGLYLLQIHGWTHKLWNP